MMLKFFYYYILRMETIDFSHFTDEYCLQCYNCGADFQFDPSQN